MFVSSARFLARCGLSENRMLSSNTYLNYFTPWFLTMTALSCSTDDDRVRGGSKVCLESASQRRCRTDYMFFSFARPREASLGKAISNLSFRCEIVSTNETGIIRSKRNQ
jgi:hypothetical protein